MAKPVAFIGMETSGRFRRRFQALGFETYSCDLLPAEDGETRWHLIGDVFEKLDWLWVNGRWPSLAIFHPSCTHVTNAASWAFMDPNFERFPGVGYHQKVKPGTLVGAARREARDASLDQFRELLALPIDAKVIENPIGGFSKVRRPSQIVQPYEFGDDASKATCFWYAGKDGKPRPEMALPIDPAKRCPGRLVERAKAMGKSDKALGQKGPAFIERWANQTDTGQNRLSPGLDRWKERSRTFDGIADAGAAHWSKFAWDL